MLPSPQTSTHTLFHLPGYRGAAKTVTRGFAKYAFYKEAPMTWEAAEVACRDLLPGGHLLTIENDVGTAGSMQAWLGAEPWRSHPLKACLSAGWIANELISGRPAHAHPTHPTHDPSLPSHPQEEWSVLNEFLKDEGEGPSNSAWFGLSTIGVGGKDKVVPTGSLAYVDGTPITWAVNNFASATTGSQTHG